MCFDSSADEDDFLWQSVPGFAAKGTASLKGAAQEVSLSKCMTRSRRECLHQAALPLDARTWSGQNRACGAGVDGSRVLIHVQDGDEAAVPVVTEGQEAKEEGEGKARSVLWWLVRAMRLRPGLCPAELPPLVYVPCRGGGGALDCAGPAPDAGKHT